MQKLNMILSVLGILFIASCSSDKGTNPKDEEPDDKDKYEIVTIGEQVWMKKNLDIAHYRNGDEIFQAKTNDEWLEAGAQGIGAWCYYDNNQGKGAIYGMLFNWYAVNDPRGLAPEGWRVPSDADWRELTKYLGSDAGAKLAGDYDLWFNGVLRNHPDFNSSGFVGLPAGSRSSFGNFNMQGGFTYWWTTTDYTTLYSFCRYIGLNNTNVIRTDWNMRHGFSVRCVKDE